MWRIFNTFCMLSVVALLGLRGGQARSGPEWLQSQSGLTDCGKRDRGALGTSASFFGVSAVGPVSHRTPPAEIERGILVWQPPWEIAPARTVANAAASSTALPTRNWAPPAEIVTIAEDRRSPVAGRARFWQPPVEVALAKTADLDVEPVASVAVPNSSELPASRWAHPTEIAAEEPAIEHRSSFTSGARDWRPPAEIAPARTLSDAVDDVITEMAISGSRGRPRSNWALPAEIAQFIPTSVGSTISNGALVWRPPAEIAKSRSAHQ